jgi:hypothetical protein
MARFQRETKVLASLDHPNTAAYTSQDIPSSNPSLQNNDARPGIWQAAQLWAGNDC